MGETPTRYTLPKEFTANAHVEVDFIRDPMVGCADIDCNDDPEVADFVVAITMYGYPVPSFALCEEHFGTFMRDVTGAAE